MLLSFFLSLGAQGGVSWWQSRFAEGTLYIRFLIQILSAIEQKNFISYAELWMYCLFNRVDVDSATTQRWNFFHQWLNCRSHEKQTTEVDSQMCGMRLVLIPGLATELGDSKCPEFPLKLLGVRAARRWPLPKATTMRPLLMPLGNAQNRRTTTSAVKLCWWTYMVPRQMLPGGNWLSTFGHQAV